MSSVILAPSILSADFGRLEAQIGEVIQAGADWIHIDVMDGRFVPNITIGPLVVRSIKPFCRQKGVPLDVHLMIESPERYVDAFADAGADRITVHVEACTHLHRTLEMIRERGLQVGVTLNPGTSLVTLEEVIPLVDLVLIMSVDPGFGGQEYIPQSTSKIARLRHMLDGLRSRAHLQVDGGIKPENVREVVQAGADVLVIGSAIFKGEGTIAENLDAFRRALLLQA